MDENCHRWVDGLRLFISWITVIRNKRCDGCWACSWYVSMDSCRWHSSSAMWNETQLFRLWIKGHPNQLDANNNITTPSANCRGDGGRSVCLKANDNRINLIRTDAVTWMHFTAKYFWVRHNVYWWALEWCKVECFSIFVSHRNKFWRNSSTSAAYMHDVKVQKPESRRRILIKWKYILLSMPRQSTRTHHPPEMLDRSAASSTSGHGWFFIAHTERMYHSEYDNFDSIKTWFRHLFSTLSSVRLVRVADTDASVVLILSILDQQLNQECVHIAQCVSSAASATANSVSKFSAAHTSLEIYPNEVGWWRVLLYMLFTSPTTRMHIAYTRWRVSLSL